MNYYGLRRTVLSALAVAVAAVLVIAAFVAAALPSALTSAVLLAVAVVGVSVLLAVPVHLLPAVALLVFAFVPMQLVPSEGIANVTRPAVLVLYVWVLRRLWTRGARGPSHHPAEHRFGGRLAVYCLSGLLALWLVLCASRSLTPTTSTAWSAGFVVSFFLPLLVFDARREAQALRRALLWTGGVLGAYAVLEQALRSSPLFDAVYAAAGAAVSSPWAVYRSEASFGHPLFAGAFLAVPAVLGVSSWLGAGPRRDLVLGALSAAGVVMTVSRGSMFAVAAGVVLAALAALLVRPRASANRAVGLVVIGAVAVAALRLFQPLTQRAESKESGLSADVRTRAIDVTLDAAAQSNWLGSGPATSGVAGRRFSDIVIENSLLQLLISVGVPGLLLFLLLLGVLCLEALRRGDVPPAAAIVAYLVAITGFNSIDAVRGMHVVLGFLLLLALNGPGGRSLPVPRAPGRHAAVRADPVAALPRAARHRVPVAS